MHPETVSQQWQVNSGPYHYQARDSKDFLMEQGTGIEPAFSAWEADALPMY